MKRYDFLITEMDSKSSKGRSSRRSTGLSSPSKTPKTKENKTEISPPSVTRRSARLQDKTDGATPPTVTSPYFGKKERGSTGRKRSLKDTGVAKE